MKGLFLSAAGLGVILLTGCAGDSPESRMAEVSAMVPGSWAATKEGSTGVDTRWVSRIGGSRASSLVDEALRNNADMRVVAERVNRAVAMAKTAGKAMNPQVSAGLNGQRNQQVFIGFPFGSGGVPSSIFSNFGSNLSVAWEADIWGFARAGQEALIAQAESEGQAYRAARASLAGQILKAWLAVGEANEQIALAKKAVETRAQTLEVIRDRFESALSEQGGSAAQMRLAQTQLETAKASLIGRRGEREQAVRQLEILIGRYPSGQISLDGGLPSVPAKPPAGLPSELLLRRPDILGAERQLAASGRRLKQGKLAFFPSFRMTASAGSATESLRDILRSDFGVWSLAGSLSQPIWAGGQLRSEVQRVKSEDRQALANLQGTVLKAFGEVEQAMVAEKFLAQRELAVAKAKRTADLAAEESYQDYAEGTSDVLTLLNAQTTQNELATQLVSLRRLRLDNRVNLHLALGGDYRVGK